MDRSLWFRVYNIQLDALFRLAFASAPHLKCLTLLDTVTRWLILQQARRCTSYGASTACRHTVLGSISLLFRGSFHLSLTVLVLYRSPVSIQSYEVVLMDSHRISRVLQYLGGNSESFRFRLRGCHALWPGLPSCSSNSMFSYSVVFQQFRPQLLPQPQLSNGYCLDTQLVQTLPRSLAATWDITFVFSSSGYQDVSVPLV
eukprot:TRINITY_DN323_c1_g1_i1.p1 TRINITY_DN323_c1_g1~~TRINITY_DN323_c1_g1_i1.p1  ORF type:complete len:201 (+),score=-36.00 TRINITY_DN323_c1_g1_i1:246-848(+)